MITAFKVHPWGITIALILTMFLTLVWLRVFLSVDWPLVWQFLRPEYGMVLL